MKKARPAEFVSQVRQEANKVTWPTRKETMMSTVMVLIMVSIAAVFFLLVDMVVFNTIQLILGLGS